MADLQRLPFQGPRIQTTHGNRVLTAEQARRQRIPTTAAVVRQGSSLLVKWNRPTPIYRQALQQIDGCRYITELDSWMLHIGHIRAVRALVERFGWSTSAEVDAIPDLGPDDFPAVVSARGDFLVIDIPWRDDIHPLLLGHGVEREPRSGMWFVHAEKALDVIIDLQRVIAVRVDGEIGGEIARSLRLLNLSRAMEPSPGFMLASAIARDMSNRPYQIAGVEYAFEVLTRREGGVFLWGTMGAGKTGVCLAALEQLHEAGELAYPALVIPPAGIKTTWFREARDVLPHRRVQVCDGEKPTMTLGFEEPDIWVCNYDILGNPKKVSWSAFFAEMDGLNGLVFDEGHRLKEFRTLQSKACLAISEAMPIDRPRFLLTGTPVRNAREDILVQLVAIARGGISEDDNGRRKIITQFGDKKVLKADALLSRRLRTVCAWRPDPKEVKRYLGLIDDDDDGEVPEEYVLVDGDPAVMVEYRRAEQEFLDWLRERAMEQARAMGLDPHAAAVRAMMKAGSAAQLMQVNALCRLAGQAKIKAAREWVDDFLTTDEQLLVFAHHHDVMDGIARDVHPQIRGDVPRKRRDILVDRFQGVDGDPIQCLVLQTQAAGEGLTLTNAHTVVHAEFEWVPGAMDQANSRAAWRMNDPHNIQAFILVCADTIDETRRGVLEHKRNEAAFVTGEQREAMLNESTFGAVWDELYRRALGEEA